MYQGSDALVLDNENTIENQPFPVAITFFATL